MMIARMFRTRWLAAAAVTGLMIGCSSDTQEQEPAMPPPKIEIPTNPSSTATTETPAASGQQTATPPAEGQADSSLEGPKLTPDEETDGS
jgi:hypothetical protein